MELKEYISDTINLSQSELDNFDNLFEVKEVVSESGKSMVFFYSKENPMSDFNIFIKHVDSEKFKDTLEAASLASIADFMASAHMSKVVEIMQVLTLNPPMLTKIKSTISALNEANTIDLIKKDAAKFTEKVAMLSGILNTRLDDMIWRSNAQVYSISGQELSLEVIDEAKILTTVLPRDDQGYVVCIGNLFENIDMAMNFPSVSEVEQKNYQYDRVWGVSESMLDYSEKSNRNFSAVVSIIPKSNPEKAMLFNKTFSDIKLKVKKEISIELKYKNEGPATVLLNKVLDSIYSDFTSNFFDVNNKNKIDTVFSLSELDGLQEFFKVKDNHYTKDVIDMSLWMKANCEKYHLENSLLGGGLVKPLEMKEALKV